MLDVSLRRLDGDTLPVLLDAAIADADPDEVMPPIDGPPGWTDARREAFRVFHRTRSIAAVEPVEQTWVIVADGTVVGAGRLEPVVSGVEIGLWLVASKRGKGVGRAAAELLVECASTDGHTRIVASTTAKNQAALRLLTAIGAQHNSDGTTVAASIKTDLQ